MLEPVYAELKVKPLAHFKGNFPRYESAQASGFDIRARIDEPVKLSPGERTLIPTGLVFEIPHGFELQVRPRSGLALKKGLTLMNAPGTIDSDYRGELKIIVVNLGLEGIIISDQDRIAQVVCCPVLQARFSVVNEVKPSQRGNKGFGVPVLNKIGLLLIFFSLGFFGNKEKVAVPRIQRAVVIENQAIIYAQPDFDAKQIMKLPNNKIIAVSTQVYRPKNLFGSFYRIFINKPQKIRGYVSEIDVLTQYKKSKNGYVLSKEYQKKEKALKQVQMELLRPKKSVPEEPNSLEKADKMSSEDISPEEKPLEEQEVPSAEDLGTEDFVPESSKEEKKLEETKELSEEIVQKESDKKIEKPTQKESSLEEKESLKE